MSLTIHEIISIFKFSFCLISLSNDMSKIYSRDISRSRNKRLERHKSFFVEVEKTFNILIFCRCWNNKRSDNNKDNKWCNHHWKWNNKSWNHRWCCHWRFIVAHRQINCRVHDLNVSWFDDHSWFKSSTWWTRRLNKSNVLIMWALDVTMSSNAILTNVMNDVEKNDALKKKTFDFKIETFTRHDRLLVIDFKTHRQQKFESYEKLVFEREAFATLKCAWCQKWERVTQIIWFALARARTFVMNFEYDACAWRAY